jgi:hypothetical protein
MQKSITTGVALAMMAVAGPAGAEDGAPSRVRVADNLARDLSFQSTFYQESDSINVANGASTGAAWLKRSRLGVSGRIMTGVPTAGDPYTVWWVVINNPDQCEMPYACNPEIDIANPATGGSAYSATGAVSSSDGNGGGVINVDVETVAGNLPKGMFELVGNNPGIRRWNGLNAEIWLVIDQHPNPGDGSLVPDLTATNFPGAGPATNERVAIFPSLQHN